MVQSHALIIEDNSKNVQVLGSLLSEQGVTHTDILDSNKISQSIENISAIDVVFLDLEMPGLDGYAVLKMLQTDPRFQTVPIVAYTVHSSEMNTAYQVGFHSFLAKPIDSDRFPDQLARIMNGEHVWERA